MIQEDLKQHGVFSWNELMTTDLNAAKAFYGELLGWTMEDIKCSGMDYTMARTAGREVAGMMVMPEDKSQGMPPAWHSYVTVDDVDASTARAESLGAKVVVPPQDVPNIGRFSVITDPQGITLGMFSYVS